MQSILTGGSDARRRKLMKPGIKSPRCWTRPWSNSARKTTTPSCCGFFENKNFAEVGAALGASEDAAKMRVSRALEKLRKFFTKRGVNSTASAIAEQISANSIQAAPVALAKAVTAVAIAKGATASISTLTLIKGALKIMAWTKVKMAIVVGTGLLVAAGTATVTINEIHQLSSGDKIIWDPVKPWF